MRKGKQKEAQEKLTVKQEKFKELLLEGWAPKKAMEAAGYSPATVNAHLYKYLRNVNFPEIWDKLRKKSAISGLRALETLDREMDGEKPENRIRAADAALRSNKTFAQDRNIQPTITFCFQTIQGKTIQISQPKDESQNDDVIDIGGQEQ